jgi:hypothetical protein
MTTTTIPEQTVEAARARGWEDGYFGRKRKAEYADRTLKAEYHKAYTAGEMERSYN